MECFFRVNCFYNYGINYFRRQVLGRSFALSTIIIQKHVCVTYGCVTCATEFLKCKLFNELVSHIEPTRGPHLGSCKFLLNCMYPKIRTALFIHASYETLT